jgi:hypothetical protein
VTTTAHEDQYAPEPVSGDPVFKSRAELEAWAKDMAGVVAVSVAFAKSGEPEHADHIWSSALDQVRRVTLAHLHLREGEG